MDGPRPALAPWGEFEFFQTDKFGRIVLVPDTEETRRQYVAVAKERLEEMYNHAVARLGEDEANRLFIAPMKRGRGKHGRRRYGLSPDRDQWLLAFYDVEAKRLPPQDKGTIPRLLAELLHGSSQRGQFGPSEAAIERRIRWLLKVRTEDAADLKERLRLWDEACKATPGREPEPVLFRRAVLRMD